MFPAVEFVGCIFIFLFFLMPHFNDPKARAICSQRTYDYEFMISQIFALHRGVPTYLLPRNVLQRIQHSCK